MDRPQKKNEITPPPADADLWTYGEVAYVLRISVASVRRLVDEGKLATTRVTVGDKRLVPRDAVRSYRERETTVADPAAATVVRTSKPIAREPKGMVKASWVTGKDHFGLDAKPGRPRKSPQS